MASETLDEAKILDGDGSPVAEAKDQADEAEAAAAEAETEVAASGGVVKTAEKGKRGRKRKTPGEAKEEGTEKKERKRRPVGSPVERPSRERKTIERFIQMSPPKVSVSKVLSIGQGPGTKLKEIPNVCFKLSKRRIDENLRVLHSILFGRKSNAHYLKRNISQFSGFVWSENEEKQKLRVKEKLDRCTKDRLLDFSELLDIQIARATTKKEEIAEKLLDFLESPHATRDVVLAEKEKKGKRKRRTKGIGQAASGGASSERELKKHSSPETEMKKGRKPYAKAMKEEEDEDDVAEKEDEDGRSSSENEDVNEGGSIDDEDTSIAEKDNGDTEDEESDQFKSKKEDEDEEQEEPTASTKAPDEKQRKASESKVKEKSSSVKKGYPAKSDKSPLKPVSKKAFSAAKDEPNAPAQSKKVSSKGQTSMLSTTSTKENAAPLTKASKSVAKSSARKSTLDETDLDRSSFKPKKGNKKDQGNENPELKSNKAVKKQAAKSVSKASTKEQGKGKAGGNSKVGPSTEELHSVVSNILKDVDFNTATLADILKQLGAHFNMNLMDRKAEVKQIIEDVINNMTDDDDDGEDGDGAEVAEGREGAKEESDEDGE